MNERRVFVRQFQRPRARQQGFTLIEIMVVIVIRGILAALVVPRVLDRPDQARRVAARQDISGLMQALKLYRLDNGHYPTTPQGLQALVQRPDGARNWRPYLDRLPNDRSEEHTSELQSLMRIQYAVFCLKKKKH